MQITFTRAWKYQHSFQGSGSYEGWLIRICRNVVHDLTKKRTDDQPLHQWAEPESADHSLEAEIDDLINELPLVQREVMRLCGVMGYDYESAAELLQIPVGTVRSRLHRGRATLSIALVDVEPIAA